MKIPSDMRTGTRHVTNKSGELEVVDYVDAKNVRVKFIATGFEIATRVANIRAGKVKDKLRPSVFGIGYLGDGEFNSKLNGRCTKEYSTWRTMLQRCYDPKCHARSPSYIGCTVCKDWRNFQNFAAWMSTQNYEGKQLDKDIKVKGNKVYSPETCSFVSHAENSVEAHAKRYTFASPTGELVEIYNLNKFCRDNSLYQKRMSAVHLGKEKQHKSWTKG